MVNGVGGGLTRTDERPASTKTTKTLNSTNGERNGQDFRRARLGMTYELALVSAMGGGSAWTDEWPASTKTTRRASFSGRSVLMIPYDLLDSNSLHSPYRVY